MPSQDSSDHDAALISESGAMNVFFLLDKVSDIFSEVQYGRRHHADVTIKLTLTSCPIGIAMAST